MSKFKLWLLRKLLRELFIHRNAVPTIMKMIWEEHQRRFYEDNTPTRYHHLKENLDAIHNEELQYLERLYGNKTGPFG